MSTDQTPEQQAEATSPGDVSTDEVLQKLRRTVKRPDDQVDSAVKKIFEEVVGDEDLIRDGAMATIDAIISKLDQQLTKQINLILHHETFQKLESSWRGLHHLVNNTETDENLKIRVLPASKKELAAELTKFRGALWDQSPLFKKVYEGGYGVLGGEPFGCLIGDYYFDHSAPDVKLLTDISHIAASAHCPFISATTPALYGMDSWTELPDPVDLKRRLSTVEFAPWNSLRESDDSRYVALTLPRFLARYPYGEKTDPVDAFAFEEETGTGDHDKYTWANAAYAMGVSITDAFKRFGWCHCIRGINNGGMFEGLPVDTFQTDEGDVAMKCPTEVAITYRREMELSNCGLLPLVHNTGTDRAVFLGGQTLNNPEGWEEGSDDEANARLSASLPYMFVISRISHHLQQILYREVGNFASATRLQEMLHKWLQKLVPLNPDNCPRDELAKKPLKYANIEVTDVAGKPGYYAAKLEVTPHYQLEGVLVRTSLVSRPSAG